MTNKIKEVLKKLKIDKTGTYENHFYIVNLENSNEYAKFYTQLEDNAINTEYPNFETNTSGTTTKAINYFELDLDNITYNIFLIADFNEDKIVFFLCELQLQKCIRSELLKHC